MTKVKKNNNINKVNNTIDKNIKPKKKHKILKGILYSILLIIFLGIIAICIGVTGFFVYIASHAPTFDEERLYTSEPSVIYAGNKVIATIGTEDRVLLTYDELPEVLVNAIIATEDSRFFQHNGIDLPRFLVASAKQILGGYGGGASTLTMQISKNVYTSKEASGFEGIIRKFTDVYMAVFKIEPSYSKEEIMEFYVNSFFLGSGYGVEVTSKNYFGKSAKDLNLAEAAMIAGLFQAPGAYNPYTNPEDTETRRMDVLYLMERHGYISDEEYDIASKMTVEKIVKENKSTDIASGKVDPDYQLFVDMVIQDVVEKTGESPYTKSMSIYTTMDMDMQKHISDIMNGKTYTWQNSKVQGGIAVVDVKTGAITAIGGGRNVESANTLNRAKNIRRQIGSTSKPLYDYGPAIEYLNWNTGTMLNDTRYSYSNGTNINNFDGRYVGWNTIEEHLKMSRNVPALKTFQATSDADKIKFVTSLGLTPDIYSCNEGYRLKGKKCINKNNSNDVVDANQSNTLRETHAIGGYEGESPLTLAAAYSAFANGGYYNEPYSFTKIVYNDTGDTYVNKTQTKQVMSDSTAYMITHMLQETAQYGSSPYKNINGVKYAAKTGTTDYDNATIKQYNYYRYTSTPVKDLWVAGYNTEYAIALWYGYDNNKDGCNSLSSYENQRLFQTVAKKIFTNKDDFKMPDSVVEVVTEKGTSGGLLPSSNTPSSYKVKSYFVSGTEPNKESTRFKTLDNVSGLSATNNGDGTATVTWTGIATPDAFNQNYIIDALAKNALPGDTASSYASRFVSTNRGMFGEVVYNVYVDNEYKGSTSSSSYQVSSGNGTHNITVKTAYSKYSYCTSGGENTSVTISGAVEIPEEPEPSEEENNEENETSDENENQDNESSSNDNE